MVLSAAATNIQLGLLLHAAVVMTAEVVSQVEYLRSRHESGLLSWQVSCEVPHETAPGRGK